VRRRAGRHDKHSFHSEGGGDFAANPEYRRAASGRD
jgi:hypothetical protein